MKANESHIYRFLDGSDKKFIIPVYQRPYSWKKQNCELLFNDLLDVYKKSYETHFFGGIVYVSYENAGLNEYIIIDGQQRITTVSILLLAIRNYVIEKKPNVEINTNKITKAYLLDEYAMDENKIKLKLVEGDDVAYERLLNLETAIEESSITMNYQFFTDEIAKLDDDELQGLYEAILKLEIVNISLNPAVGDDPQLIFESLNSTGVSLEESDKIRNFILMNQSAKEQERIYKKYWKSMETMIPHQEISSFIRHYLATKTFELVNEKKLYFAFKHYKTTKSLDTEDLLVDMVLYAQWYHKIKNATATSPKYESILFRLNKLDVNTCIPLLFDLFQARETELLSDDELEKSCETIENYVMRRNICGLPNSQLNKMFVSITNEIKKSMEKDGVTYYSAFIYAFLSKKGKNRFPTNQDFHDKFTLYELYNAKSAHRKHFFEQIENYASKEKIAVSEQLEANTLTIEHIMPQTLNEVWKTDLGNNWEFIHSKYKDTVGNLTLTAYNSDYSNLPFMEKRNMPEKGFSFSKLELNQSLKTCSCWNEATILERAEILYKKAEKIWWYPETTYSSSIEEQWVDWDEDFEFTNTSILMFKLFGNEIITKNIADAYKKILQALYQSDSVMFLSKENVIVKRNPENLIKEFEVTKGIYVELTLNSQQKMDNIQRLAKLYQLDSKDICYLVKAKSKD